MQINRSEITSHLQKLHCKKHISEVVLTEGFAAVALNGELMVSTDGLEGMEPLAEPVGIIDLDLFIKSLNAMGEDEDQVLSVEFEDNRITISRPHKGTVRLVTSLPEHISTKVGDDTFKAVMGVMKGSKPVPLPQTLVEGIKKMVGILSADEVAFKVGRKETQVLIGRTEADSAELLLENMKVKKVADEYSIQLDADLLVAVLDQISDYTQSEIVFSGPDSFIQIKDPVVTYTLSPMEPEEEAKS